MKNRLKLLFFVFALLVMAQSVSAQSVVPTFTTLSAAVSGGAANNQIPVTATTGISASTTSVSALSNTGGQQLCMIDHEIVGVAAVNTTTKVLTVRRALGGTGATPHANASFILCGPGGGIFNVNTGNTSGVFLGTAFPTGGCTAANNQYLPIVAYDKPADSWELANCNNGVWQAQIPVSDLGTRTTRYCAPNFIGALTLLTSFGDAVDPIVIGNNTTPVSGTVLYGSIDVPQSFVATGVSVLNGTVAATNALEYGLHRADGVLIANTAVAGTTAAGVGAFQDIPFTATYLVTGPARYWISWQTNGTTTRVRTVNLTPGSSTAGLGAWIGMLGSSFTGTFGTIPNLAASGAVDATHPSTTALPTTLISNTAPVGCIY